MKSSKNLMHLSQATYRTIAQLADAVNQQQLSISEAAALVAQEQQSNPSGESLIPGGAGDVPSLFAWAEGFIDGKKVKVQRAIGLKSYPPGGMGGMMGILLAVGLFLLTEDKLVNKGVLTPEMAYDPDEFLGLFARYYTYPAPPVTDEEFLAITGRT